MTRLTEAGDALKTAYELRDRASEREKFYIQAHYYDEVILDGDKASAAYAEWRQTYPRDTIPYDNGALACSELGQHEKALDLASQAMRLDPKDAYAYANLSSAYEALNWFDEARSVGEQAVAPKLDGPAVRGVLTDLAYIRGDWTAYDHYVGSSRGTSKESFVLFFKALGQDSLGKVQAGREPWRQARSELLAAGIRDFAGALFAAQGIDDNLLGHPTDARHHAGQGLELSKNPDVRCLAAIALASAGEVARSRVLLSDLSRDFPDNHFIHSGFGSHGAGATISAAESARPSHHCARTSPSLRIGGWTARGKLRAELRAGIGLSEVRPRV